MHYSGRLLLGVLWFWFAVRRYIPSGSLHVRKSLTWSKDLMQGGVNTCYMSFYFRISILFLCVICYFRSLVRLLL